MSSLKSSALGAFALVVCGSAAHAEDASRWFVHAGPALVAPDEKAKITAGGAPVPGGSVSIDSRWTVEGEVGYYVTPNIAIAVAGGAPPKFKVNAAGTIAALGAAGQMTGGPAGVMVQYHFNREGRIRPYVGAGASFLIVFSTEDGAMSNLKAKSAVGTVVQVGSDFMVNPRWGAFIDVKKAWVGTLATAFLGPNPVRAKVSLDPIVTNFGVTYRF
jgi:outer membrane protein